jgi:hypothetical protein
MTVGADRDGPVEIGPEEPGAGLLEAGDGPWGGMPVGVACARADDGDMRREAFDERIGRRGRTAVVGDLQHVESATVGRRQPGGQQLWVDVLLDVAGQQQPPIAKAQVEDERNVIDLFARARRTQRHASGQRPVDVDRDAVEKQPITGGDHPRLATQLGHPTAKGGVARSRSNHAWFDHAADPVAVEQQRQARHVVLVRVSDGDQIQAAVPRR